MRFQFTDKACALYQKTAALQVASIAQADNAGGNRVHEYFEEIFIGLERSLVRISCEQDQVWAPDVTLFLGVTPFFNGASKRLELFYLTKNGNFPFYAQGLPRVPSTHGGL